SVFERIGRGQDRIPPIVKRGLVRYSVAIRKDVVSAAGTSPVHAQEKLGIERPEAHEHGVVQSIEQHGMCPPCPGVRLVDVSMGKPHVVRTDVLGGATYNSIQDLDCVHNLLTKPRSSRAQKSDGWQLL